MDLLSTRDVRIAASRRVGDSPIAAFPTLLHTDAGYRPLCGPLACLLPTKERRAGFRAPPDRPQRKYRQPVKDKGKDVFASHLNYTAFGAKSGPTLRPLPISATNTSPAGGLDRITLQKFGLDRQSN